MPCGSSTPRSWSKSARPDPPWSWVNLRVWEPLGTRGSAARAVRESTWTGVGRRARRGDREHGKLPHDLAAPAAGARGGHIVGAGLLPLEQQVAVPASVLEQWHA